MDYMETVARWAELNAAIKHLQAEERALREGLFSGTFPAPREGVNTVTLPDGRILKGTYKLNRKLIREQYLENWSTVVKDIPSAVAASLVKVDYSLVTSAYKGLPDDHRKAVDSVLEIKPALPTLELVETDAD